MNPTGDQQPPQPHRPSTSCDLHPDEPFTGFCPSCLFERLSVLDQAANSHASSSSRKPPVSSTLKSISNTFFPELRRSKSFSASKTQGFSGAFEPHRKSCDVRGRNTLWSLFNFGEIESQSKNLGASSTTVQGPVESQTQSHSHSEHEIMEEEEEQGQEEIKSMKDHIDLDSQKKKPTGREFKDIAVSFWSAASVFSKKLQNWRQKQKLKKCFNGGGSATLPVEKPIEKQYRETQSEIADYGFGRRSCDMDRRFSLDIGRISIDDPRYSFDEPRASWDGYMIGRTTVPRMPTMLSVVEDDAPVHVLRSDNLIPLEEPPRVSVTEAEMIPGGTEQTRDYYSDSSSRRRKSLDRSSSIRKTAAAVVAEIDEMVYISNSKVSPASIDCINGPKLVVPDRALTKVHNSNSFRDDCSQTFESSFKDNASVVGNGEMKGNSKKSRRWSIWGFIHSRGSNKDEDVDRISRTNGVGQCLSEPWQEFRREQNGDARGAKFFRSNSSVSWRNSNIFSSSFGNVRHDSAKGNCKKARDEFVLERSRSARYSPSTIDNGPLRFYLAPVGSSRRGGSGKSRSNQAHSIARTILKLY